MLSLCGMSIIPVTASVTKPVTASVTEPVNLPEPVTACITEPVAELKPQLLG